MACSPAPTALYNTIQGDSFADAPLAAPAVPIVHFFLDRKAVQGLVTNVTPLPRRRRSRQKRKGKQHTRQPYNGVVYVCFFSSSQLARWLEVGGRALAHSMVFGVGWPAQKSPHGVVKQHRVASILGQHAPRVALLLVLPSEKGIRNKLLIAPALYKHPRPRLVVRRLGGGCERRRTVTLRGLH